MRKRLKVSIACDTCRSRKVKCNGALPVCDVCNTRQESATCTYGKETRRFAPIQENTPGLSHHGESQIRQSATLRPALPEVSTLLRDSNAAPIQRMSPLQAAPNKETHGISAPWLYSHASSPSSRNDQRRSFSWSCPDSSRSYHKPPDVADSMTGVVGEPSETHEFFGNSSAGSFMRQMQHAIDAKLGVFNSSSVKPADHGIIQSSDHTKRTIEYVLPPRRMADELVEAYWELVYPLYPFLDRYSFMSAYEYIWTGSDTGTDESLLLCTVNVMFALGAQVSGIFEPEQRQGKAQMYFNRAQSLIDNNPWENGSVNYVSCLLLTGIYLQSANSPQRCWMVIGYAIRMAQSLGLHLPEYNAAIQTQREKEMARRIWHGCVLMDRVLAMTFGRPAMIPEWLSALVPLPQMIDDDFLDVQSEGASVRPDNELCLMEVFVSQLKLHNIINNILLELYIVHDGRQNAADIVTAFKLDEELVNWASRLSDWLQLDAPLSCVNSLHQRLAIVNRLRFLHARLLLLRPILAQYCLPHHSTKPVKSLASTMTIQCSSMCLETAHHVIDIIYSNLDLVAVFGPLPAWWYSVLYVYTAATVLLAERIRPEIGANIEQSSNAVSWGRAIQVLRAYARVGNSAKRCVAALEILSAKIPRSAESSDSFLPNPDVHTSPALFEIDEHEIFSQFDLDSISLDLNHVDWLHSVPESLQIGPR